MNSIEKNNNYDMMDIFRLFFALCVVGLHVPLFDKNSSLNSVVSVVIFEMAVPFFFIVSSFLFFTKCQEASKPSLYLKKHEKRLLILYVSWSLIYLPFSLWTSFNHSFDSISLKYLLAELINYFKLFLFESAYVHLWYVNTTIVCIAILFFLRKHISEKAIVILSIIICILFSLLSSDNGKSYLSNFYFKFVPYLLRNTFRKGLICCSIGMLFAYKKPKNNTWSYLLIIIIVSAIEIYFIFSKNNGTTYINDGLSYVFSTIKAACIFLICTNIKLSFSLKYKVIRNFSSLIYFSHLIVRDSSLILLSNFRPFAWLPDELGKYIVTIIISFVFSILIYLLSEKNKLGFLKKIY